MLDELISEKYRLPNTNAYNWSKFSRENIAKPSPKFKVGDKVKFSIETVVTKVGNDCDGATLYGLEMLGFGWDEGSLEGD